MKPVLALDADGVLVDFDNPALEYLHAHGVTKTYDEITNWSVFDGDMEMEMGFRREVAGLPDFCRSMRALPGAVEFVQSARELYDIVIVTAPYDVPHWYEGREAWVVKNLGLPRKNVCFLSRKEFFDSDILVDDKVENVVSWHNRHPRRLAIIKDQPWNQDRLSPSIKRAMSWTGLSNILEEHGFPPVRGVIDR
jgi:5'(3')-deoxyribonucleotidase